MFRRRHTDVTFTPRARWLFLSNAWCAAAQQLFFEIPYVHPRPFTGQGGVSPFQRRIDVGIGQRTLQLPDPAAQLLQFVNFIQLFHAYPYASTPIAIFPHPFENRYISSDLIPPAHRFQRQALLLNFANHSHLNASLYRMS